MLPFGAVRLNSGSIRRCRAAALCTSRSAAGGASGSLTPAAGLDSRSRAAAAAIRRRARKVTSALNVSRTVAAPGRSLFGSPESNSARSWAGYTGKDLSDQREKTPIRSVEEGLRMILDMDVVYIVAGLIVFVWLAGVGH